MKSCVVHMGYSTINRTSNHVVKCVKWRESSLLSLVSSSLFSNNNNKWCIMEFWFSDPYGVGMDRMVLILGARGIIHVLSHRIIKLKILAGFNNRRGFGVWKIRVSTLKIIGMRFCKLGWRFQGWKSFFLFFFFSNRFGKFQCR